MAGINFLSENFVNDSTINITTGAANAQFPTDNIKNPSTGKKFRSAGNTVVLEFDLLQTRDIDTLAFVGDATDQIGITAISIKTSTTTDFSGSPTNVVPFSSTENIGYLFITEVSHRYVEVTLTGTGSFAELSNLFVGKRINLTQNSLSINSFRYGHEDPSIVSTNRYGQKFVDELPLRKKITGTIEYCTKSEQEDLDDIFIKHGRHEPLWVIVDESSAAINSGQFKLAIYSYLNRAPEWSAAGGQLYSATLDLRQVI